MMKLILMLGAILGASTRVWGDATMSGAASRAWVTNYVARAIASSRAEVEAGTVVTRAGGSMAVTANPGMAGEMRLVVQDFTDAAMVATNCTASAIARGVTNGTVFVWNGAGAYVNPSGVISCTATNLVFSGVGSVAADGVERFAGWFDAYGGLIQANASFAITNGMAEAKQ